MTDQKPRRIVVALEGGLVTAIVTDCPELKGIDVFVVDYDTEGCDPDELVSIVQGDGSSVDARAYADGIETARIDVDALEDAIDRKSERS